MSEFSSFGVPFFEEWEDPFFNIVSKLPGRTGKITFNKPKIVVSMYVDSLMSCDEIARILGVGKRRVQVFLRSKGVKIRSAREAMACSPFGMKNNAELQKEVSRRTFKGGRKVHSKQRPYIMWLRKDHPAAGKSGYVFEHRLVAEKMIGRSLHKTEDVHHKNENVQDNRPENLEIMTRPQHMSVHMTKRHEARRKGMK